MKQEDKIQLKEGADTRTYKFRQVFFRAISLKVFSAVMIILLFTGCAPRWAEEAGEIENKLIVNVDQGREKISRFIYGQFSEHLGRGIYGGIWVGQDSAIPNTRGIRNDVVDALRKIKVPILRWPGGCFADEYHWKDGIGPRENRPTIINTHWGGVTENNHFGTHEFLDLCEQLGCEPYICVNVGSGTVQEASQWVEYITFGGRSPMTEMRRANGRDEPWKVKFWAVGNENEGCGGNMLPDYYANLYRRFQTYMREYPGNEMYKVACGPNPGWAYHWMETVLSKAGGLMDGISLHHYSWSGKKSRSATEFEEVDWFALLQKAVTVEEYLTKQIGILDKHDPRKRIGLAVDEWGAWHEVEPGTNPGFLYQQNTLRDALLAGIHLNMFNRHCDRVKISCIAQMVNVLQAMILTQGEKMIVTPTYYVFDMYKVHQGARLLPCDLQCGRYEFEDESIPALNASASRDRAGKIHISICNVDPDNAAKVLCELRGKKVETAKARILTSSKMNTHNTFEEPDAIRPCEFRDYELENNRLSAVLPSKSIVVFEIQ